MAGLRFVLLLSLISATTTGALTWWLNEDRYTATFQFRVTASTALLDNRTRTDAFEIYKNSQRQYLRSDYVLSAALRHEAVTELPVIQRQSNPPRWLADNIRVEFPGDGEVMNISLTADTPNEAALIVAAVSKAYLDEVVYRERWEQMQHSGEVQDALEEHKKKAEEKRSRLKELAEKLGTSQTLTSELEKWTAVRRELIRAQNTVKRLDAELKLKQAELQQNLQVEQLANLKSEIARLEKELTNHRALVKQLEEDEAKLRDQLKPYDSLYSLELYSEASLEVEDLKRQIERLDEIIEFVSGAK